jgi:hypothetical protein
MERVRGCWGVMRRCPDEGMMSVGVSFPVTLSPPLPIAPSPRHPSPQLHFLIHLFFVLHHSPQTVDRTRNKAQKR